MDALLALAQQILEYLNEFKAGTIIQVIRDALAKLIGQKDQ